MNEIVSNQKSSFDFRTFKEAALDLAEYESQHDLSSAEDLKQWKQTQSSQTSILTQ